MTNSDQKGKVGEREFANFLKAHGIEARRGQQFSGGGDSPDVVHSLPGIHFEVKRVEKFALWDAIEQAETDRKEADIPVVAHRKNRREWVVVLYAEDFIHLMKNKDQSS